MRFIFITAALFGLAGCPGDKDDTGTTTGTDDTGTTTTGEAFALLRDAEGKVGGTGATGDCTETGCTYTMTTTTEAGTLVLDMTETADTVSTTPWTEQHTGFALDSENADGSFTYKLVLAAAASFDVQVANESTLFYRNPDNEDLLEGVTWLFSASSADGSENDCMTTGHDTSYYASDCTYVE